jgi:hypothetical protein
VCFGLLLGTMCVKYIMHCEWQWVPSVWPNERQCPLVKLVPQPRQALIVRWCRTKSRPMVAILISGNNVFDVGRHLVSAHHQSYISLQRYNVYRWYRIPLSASRSEWVQVSRDMRSSASLCYGVLNALSGVTVEVGNPTGFALQQSSRDEYFIFMVGWLSQQKMKLTFTCKGA